MVQLKVKNYGMIRLLCLMFLIPFFFFFGCKEDDEEDEMADGTLTVRLTNAPANYDVYFSVVNEGENPGSNPDAMLARNIFTLDSNGEGEAAALTLDGTSNYVFSGGEKYDIYLFLDSNGNFDYNNNEGMDSGDVQAVSYGHEIDGNTIANLDYNTIEKYVMP
jgi:hypothetical protein